MMFAFAKLEAHNNRGNYHERITQNAYLLRYGYHLRPVLGGRSVMDKWRDPTIKTDDEHILFAGQRKGNSKRALVVTVICVLLWIGMIWVNQGGGV
jgi:hypothetical protein